MKKQKQKTILLVEDDTVATLIETHMLKSFGYEVVAVTSGEEAVQLAVGNDNIALVLMDINLGPGMDGTEAARQILGKRDVPVVFLTAHTEEEYVERVKAITRYGYVLKAFDKFVIQSSIEMAFELFEVVQALRESNVRFNQLAAQSGTIVWEVDAQGLYTYLSPVSEAVLGYRPDEIVGRMHFYDLCPESGREKFKIKAMAVIERKECFRNFVNAVQAKDGRQMWVLTNGAPLLSDNGSLTGYRGSDTDITERKRAEEALRESEERFRLLFENMTEGVALHEMLYDEQGRPVDYRILSVNGAYEQFTGIPSARAVGSLASELYGVASPPYIAEYESAVVNEKPFVFETYFHQMAKYFSISVFSLKQDRFVTVFQDISEHKQVEKTLKEAYAGLEDKVRERTRELQARLDELERFRKATVEREFRMKALRDEIERLKSERNNDH